MKLNNCTLVKVIPRGNRLTFVFNHPNIKNSPMRTMDARIGVKKRTMFEDYCLIILGYIPLLNELEPYDLSNMLLDKSKDMHFKLNTQPSKCRRFTDILNIERE